MSTSPTQVRAAAAAFIAAIERHLAAVERRTGEADPVVHHAFGHLAEAFVVYEDALYDTYDEVTPFDVADDEDEDDDDDDLDDYDEDEDTVDPDDPDDEDDEPAAVIS